MARTVRIAAATLAIGVAGGLAGLPADAAPSAADRVTISRNCSGPADAELRVWREDGNRYVRMHVSNAMPGSRWSLGWSYSTGQSGDGADGRARASDAGTWSRTFSTSDGSRHFVTSVRARSVAGQVCRVRYEQ
jgi:hypothetical protein